MTSKRFVMTEQAPLRRADAEDAGRAHMVRPLVSITSAFCGIGVSDARREATSGVAGSQPFLA